MRKPGLATQVFIGLGLGVVVGLFFGEKVAFLKIAGDAFIGLLQITVIPYVVIALITSLGRLTFKEVKELGFKAGGVLLVLWGIGLAVVFLSPLAMPDWTSASFFKPSQVQATKNVDFLQLYIPSNPFFALSNSIIPAIVVFSILFGLALINVEHKERLLNLLSTVGDALLTLTGFIGRLAPYGVFAITGAAAGTIDISDLGRLQVYLVIYVGVALLLSFWVVPGLVTALTPLRYGAILRTFRAPLVTAFATGNVLIVLPMLAAESRRLLSETDSREGKPEEHAWSSVDVLIPASFPFPTLGAVLALLFVLFGGWFVGSPVPLSQYPTLAGLGLASLFGGTVLSLPFLFDLLRLPSDLFQVFVSVDVVGSRFGTLLAAMHIIAIALIGSYALQGRVRLRPVPVLRFAVVSVALLAGLLFGIRGFYTHIYVHPYTKDKLLAGLHLHQRPQPQVVHRDPAEPGLGPAATPRERIPPEKRGVLRVCYLLDDYPLAFFNSSN
ncbi:MAG TPA: cation:dicarboxylase symporter family transporter, partial [Verrucomicrobiae bacterium]|nr:cation:dicarboxylase symporter family transporter [Verrucomicrobiae bacterium]